MSTVLIKPLITEKSMREAGRGWFTFLVNPDADKKRIARDIHDFYGVDVLGVRTISTHGKIRRVGRGMKPSQMPNQKKAIVHLKAGQTIDAFQIGGEEGKK